MPHVEIALVAHSPPELTPNGMGAQVPFAPPVSAALHATHVPLHIVPQHTPSTQKPVVHWLFAPHGLPVPSVGTQLPPMQ